MATRQTQPEVVQTTAQAPAAPVENPDGPQVATLDSLFNKQATVVDEVVEVPLRSPDAGGVIIRPNRDIEEMSVGTDYFTFKMGVRYRVPERVAQILFDRDLLMEFPYKG